MTLATEKYEGDVPVDRCPLCHGLWLDKGELEAVQKTLEHDYSKELTHINTVAPAYEMARQRVRPVVNCPKCRSPLHAEEYAYCSQILIDRCGKCGGIWLDTGEVQALEQFFERERGAHKDILKGFFASLLERLR
jgi:Zn-finger nucleic acid-binding protein